MVHAAEPKEQPFPAPSRSSSKRVLITGGSGFLGAILAENLSREHEVAFTFNSHEIEIPGCRGLRMDITRPESIAAVMQAFEPQAVIHAAAQANAALCQQDQEAARAVNLLGTERLLDALPTAKTRFIYISTDLVFDGENAPYSEKSEPRPISLYGISKLSAERTVLERGAASAVLRPALIYGPRSASGKGSFLQWMDDAFQKGEPLKLFENEARTPVYALDIVRALRAFLAEGTGGDRLYHLGGPERLTRVQFARKLAEIRGYDPGLIIPVQLGDVDTGYPRARDVSLDSRRIVETFGLRLTPAEEALWEMFGK